MDEIFAIQTFHFLTSGHWHNEIHIGNLEKNQKDNPEIK
jgi:hypothetical protein